MSDDPLADFDRRAARGNAAYWAARAEKAEAREAVLEVEVEAHRRGALYQIQRAERAEARVAELEEENNILHTPQIHPRSAAAIKMAGLQERVAELEAEKEKLIGYGDVLGLRVRQAEARAAELEAENAKLKHSLRNAREDLAKERDG